MKQVYRWNAYKSECKQQEIQKGRDKERLQEEIKKDRLVYEKKH